ncbi:hypothetical protein WJX79_004901 [Trebouxia sp. C0005]
MGEVPSMVCKYYLAGHCSYGDKCRYDHKRPAWSQAAKAKQAFSKPAQLPRNDTHQSYGYSDYGEYFGEDAYGPEAGDDWDQLGFAAEQECTQHPENEYSEAASDKKPASRRTPSEQALCSQYQVSGHCPRGTDCHMAHGDLCQICGRYMLHPHNEQQQKEHSSEGWRSHHEGGADTDTALRTCPLCRTPCWFVTPSSIWPANQEDKDRIVAGYKAKLGSIDCRHWNFGENTCPFGTSCFYRHIYPDGPPQEAVLRKYGNSEGEVKILQPVRLSDFIQISSQRRPLRGIR